MTKFRLLLRRRRVAVVASILIGVLAGVVSSITGSGGRDITTWEAMQVVFVNFDFCVALGASGHTIPQRMRATRFSHHREPEDAAALTKNEIIAASDGPLQCAPRLVEHP